ncbi:hypothetical protein LTR28_007054 [Elasticomyces elasticus]|nr:hypothetical protein LTR28_007054 [Elasticomyces elasticus]
MTDVAVFKKRASKGANSRKRPATPPPESDSQSDHSSGEENGVRVKRRKIKGLAAVQDHTRKVPVDLSKSTTFAADRSSTIRATDDATKHSNWYDGSAADAAQRASTNGSSSALSVPGEALDGTYKGSNAYKSFITKNPNAPKKQVGPIKAPTNIRTITVTDFAPDVCKDYRQTGFCGFGDSCKYLHMREDYKAGWQLDKEWEKVTKGKKNLGGTTVASADRKARKPGDDGYDAEEEEERLLENIPFACVICRAPYKNPIVTKCGHYFCEKCAMDRYRSKKGGKTCAACGADTGGTFNVAKSLKKLLDRKTERERLAKEAARAAGEEVSGDEGEA